MTDIAATRPRTRPRAKLSNSHRESLAAAAFLAPNVIGFILLSLGPVIFSLVISFTNWGGLNVPKFIGIDNFIRLLGDGLFRRSVGNTLLFTVMFVPLALVVLDRPRITV